MLLSTFQSERFLAYQLEQLARQSIWPKAELLIVANEPSPAEGRAIDQFKKAWKDRVRLFIVPRESLYASWNRAIQVAKAGLLAIANVDDIRTQAGLEEQVLCLETTPEAIFSYGSFMAVRRFRSQTGRVIEPPAFDSVEFTRSMHAGPFMVWRRKVNGRTLYFDEQFRSGGDFDLAIRLACLGCGARVHGMLGYYFDGGRGLSTGSRLQPIERTVIELRYGIFDKLDYDYLPDAIRYNISSLFWNGSWHAVAHCVPDYEQWIAARRTRWFSQGLERRDKPITAQSNGIRLSILADLVRKYLRSV